MLVARVDTGPGKVIKLLKFRVSDSGLGVGRGEGKGGSCFSRRDVIYVDGEEVVANKL